MGPHAWTSIDEQGAVSHTPEHDCGDKHVLASDERTEGGSAWMRLGLVQQASSSDGLALWRGGNRLPAAARTHAHGCGAQSLYVQVNSVAAAHAAAHAQWC